MATQVLPAQSRSRERLFLASCIALVATAMTFAVRADIMDALGHQFHLDKEQVGAIAGIAFLGFTIAIFFGGQVVDALGMGRVLALAFVCHLSGIVLTIGANGYWTLWMGTLLLGLGNGLIEAAVNPLIATMYADNKTPKLNALHAWFPGGIVIGGVLAYGISTELHLPQHLGWQVKMATIILPTVAYGLLFLGQKYPATERVQSNISTGAMYREALRPLFLLWMFCMLLTAATELATGQWIGSILANVAGASSILILVLINAIMYVGRSFAAPVVHRLSPVGMLTGSAAFALVGLLAMSYAASRVGAFAAASVFAVGVCYFWPTMLGVTSERFPRGGAFLLGLMGAAGNLSVAIVLPCMGHVQDISKNHPELALRYMAILPAILIIIFAAIYLSDKTKGGYRAEVLSAPIASEEALATPL